MTAEIEIPYPRPKRLLVIDPGARSGVAVYVLDAGLGRFRLDGAWEVNGTVRAISDTVTRFSKGEGGVVVVERQFFTKFTKKGGDDAIQLHGMETLLRARHSWEIIAEVFCLPSVLVYPASWQAVAFKGMDRGKGRSKVNALAACLDRWPKLSHLWETHEDARDAALLGRFYADKVEEKIA